MLIGAYVESILNEVVADYAPKELHLIETSIEVTDQEANLNVVLIVGGTEGHPYSGRAVKFPAVLPDEHEIREWAVQVCIGAKSNWLTLKSKSTEHEG
jgi:hypothetical protein